ncbi:hypothetical protein ACU4GD_24365 [Cupriavidus basilensis]
MGVLLTRRTSRPQTRAAAKPLYFNHSPYFAPVPEPSIKTGVTASEPGRTQPACGTLKTPRGSISLS